MSRVDFNVLQAYETADEEKRNVADISLQYHSGFA
jgi:hypothetical protein